MSGSCGQHPLSRAEIEAGYRAMAADEEREREALDWAEGLVQDIADDPDGPQRSEPTGERMNKPTADFATVDLVDAYGERLRSCPVQFRNLTPSMRNSSEEIDRVLAEIRSIRERVGLMRQG